MSHQEHEVMAFIKLCQDSRDKRGSTYVVSESKLHHVPDTCHFVDLPVFKWKARCGWMFSLSDFTCSDTAAPESRCRKSMPSASG